MSMWSWWDPSHRGPAAADMPSESIKAAAPPSPRFVSRPVAHTQTVTEKNHLLHSMTVFWGFFRGFADLPHAQQLPRLPLGYSQKPWTIPSILSPFCAQHTYVVAKKRKQKKKKTKQREYTFFSSFGNTDENFCYCQRFKFSEKRRKINKNGLMLMHFRENGFSVWKLEQNWFYNFQVGQSDLMMKDELQRSTEV